MSCGNPLFLKWVKGASRSVVYPAKPKPNPLLTHSVINVSVVERDMTHRDRRVLQNSTVRRTTRNEAGHLVRLGTRRLSGRCKDVLRVTSIRRSF